MSSSESTQSDLSPEAIEALAAESQSKYFDSLLAKTFKRTAEDRDKLRSKMKKTGQDSQLESDNKVIDSFDQNFTTWLQ